ncbi:hypothetical protein IJG76_00715 [Candidatus Saccharibacteria bacterium]|nr:hypothetical protein [Candidatus Saccharibacteria bacterium]
MQPENNTNNIPTSEPAPTIPDEPVELPGIISSANEKDAKAAPAMPAPTPIPEPSPDLSPLADVATDDSIKIGEGTEEKPKKSKKPLIFSLIGVVLASGLGTGIYFATRPTVPAPSSEPATQTSQTEPAPVTVPESKLKMTGNSLSDFDLAFLKLGDAAENKIYSPLSIKYALAMLEDATAGLSKAEIESVLGDYAPVSYINSENLSLANALFVRTDWSDKVSTVYQSALKGKYNAEIVNDAFATPYRINNWIEENTLGIIKNFFTTDQITPDKTFVLVNALGIDMSWNYQLQCISSTTLTSLATNQAVCKNYTGSYSHEKYNHYISDSGYSKIDFNGHQVDAAHIGASINRYDIVKELGEDHIRETVLEAYEQYKLEQATRMMSYEDDYDIDKYLEELKSNYGKVSSSTDFTFADNKSEKVFRKELKKYDGTTLEYIAIMPLVDTLEDYVKKLTASDLESVIKSTRTIETSNFKDGVVTKVNGYIPFFDFSATMDLTKLLPELGISDVFNPESADLSAIAKNADDARGLYIDTASHKADITFSNDGIRAAAATAFGGTGSSAGGFEYKWDVPVEEIDLTFDKPFLFIIRNQSSGEVWFVGQVTEINN